MCTFKLTAVYHQYYVDGFLRHCIAYTSTIGSQNCVSVSFCLGSVNADKSSHVAPKTLMLTANKHEKSERDREDDRNRCFVIGTFNTTHTDAVIFDETFIFSENKKKSFELLYTFIMPIFEISIENALK